MANFIQSEQPSPPLMSLPREVRDEIYDFVLDWPEISNVLKMTAGKRALLSTPSLLLINHKISSEAIPILYGKSLTLDTLPSMVCPFERPFDITEFISKNTLQHVRFVRMRMDLNHDPNHSSEIATHWLITVSKLNDIWTERNCLKELVIEKSYTKPSTAAGWTFADAAYHNQAVNIFSLLEDFVRMFPAVVHEEPNISTQHDTARYESKTCQRVLSKE